MGKNQDVVSIDKSYNSLFVDIAKVDKIYINPSTKRPNKKRICQDALRIFHLMKTGACGYLLVGVPKRKPTKKEIETIKNILGGKCS